MNALLWYTRRLRLPNLGLVWALTLGIAALVTVSAFAERLSTGLRQAAAQALGGDAVLIADHPIPAHFAAEAQRLNLSQAHSISFPSMVLANGHTRLVEVKAVSLNYPLLGTLRVDGRTAHAPPPGQAWVEAEVLESLKLALGESFTLGQLSLTAAGRLEEEPDRAPSAFILGPRVMIAAEDLPASGLLGFGARASYRLHLSGPPEARSAFAAYAQAHPERGLRLEGLEDARPELRETLERAESLLRLGGLLALLLAGVAIAMGLQDRLRRQLDATAVLRALGAKGRWLLQANLLALWPYALLGSLLGIALGYLVQPLLPWLLAGLLPTALPAPSLLPAVLGLAAGLVLTLALALPAVLRLTHTPTLRILRRHLEPPAWGRRTLGALLLSAMLLVGLVLFIAGPNRLTAAVLGGTAGLCLLLLALASLPLWLVRQRWLKSPPPWLAHLAAPGRRPHLTLTALGLGLLGLALALSLRHDVLDGWMARLPTDAPNRFVINILEEQRSSFTDLVTAAGLPAPALKPMIRGRLLTIDGRAVETLELPDPRSRALAEREFNLSMSTEHPTDNRIIAGRHWQANEVGQPWLSVEEGIAQRLGIKLGSRLEFEIAGETWVGTVLNLRRVRWDSFNVNFFVTAPAGALEGYPATWITSFYLPDDRAALSDQLVAALPNITIIDTRAALRQVREVLARIEGAVSLILGFVLLSAWLVVWQTAASTVSSRRQETALLRALGASRHWLRRELIGEYALLGLFAGLLAALASTLVSAALGRLILEDWITPSPLLWLLTPLLGAVLSTIAGWLALRDTLNTPPSQVWREG